MALTKSFRVGVLVFASLGWAFAALLLSFLLLWAAADSGESLAGVAPGFIFLVFMMVPTALVLGWAHVLGSRTGRAGGVALGGLLVAGSLVFWMLAFAFVRG